MKKFKLDNKKFAIFLISLGAILMIYTYYLDGFFDDDSQTKSEELTDLSWLDTYGSEGSELVLRKVENTVDELEIVPPFDEEKQNFIDASVEVTCKVFATKDVFSEELDKDVKSIYLDYGFNAYDQSEIENLTKKYADDLDLQMAVLAEISKCSCKVDEMYDFKEELCVNNPNFENKLVR